MIGVEGAARAQPEGGTAERLAARMREWIGDWGAVIRDAHVSAAE